MDWLFPTCSLLTQTALAQTGGLNVDISKIFPDIPFILQGIVTTLQFTLVSALLGFTWGTALSLFKISNIKPLRWFADFYTSIFRGTPLLLQLAIIYYGFPQLFKGYLGDYVIQPFEAGVMSFALNSAAYSSETIRAGILAVDKGQREAAMSLGVAYPRMMWDIVLPQAFKNILPALVNESIALLKDSSLVSVVGAQDLMRRADIVRSTKFLFFEPYLFVGLIYYVMITGFTIAARRLEERLRKSD